MLAGEPPFTGPTARAVVALLMSEEPQPVSRHRRSVPEHVAAAVMTALEKIPADRFTSVRAFRDALQGAGAPTPRRRGGAPRRPRARPLAVGVALVAIAALLRAGLWAAWPASVPQRVIRFAGPVPPGDIPLAVRLAISPDGRELA